MEPPSGWCKNWKNKLPHLLLVLSDGVGVAYPFTGAGVFAVYIDYFLVKIIGDDVASSTVMCVIYLPN